MTGDNASLGVGPSSSIRDHIGALKRCWPWNSLGMFALLPSSPRMTMMNKKSEEILTGFDRMIEKIEAMPVTAEEKRRLLKEWLRSRLAELETSKVAD